MSLNFPASPSQEGLSYDAKAAASAAGKFHPLRIQDVRLDTVDALLVTFSVPETLRPTFSFKPGQHLVLRTTIEGAEIRRTYSICAAVQDNALRIAIKRAPTGVFSTWAFDHLKPDMTIDVMPPLGRFGLPLSVAAPHNYLAFAAGSGITPIFSIVKSTLMAEAQTQVTLFYGNRSTSTVMLRNELGDLKDIFVDRFTLIHVLTRERQESDLLYGRIDHAKCRELLQHWASIPDIDAAFICGPGSMLKEVKSALLVEGLADSKIRSELFISPHNGAQPRPLAACEQQCSVTLILDGIERRFTMPRETESVLKAGLRHGIDLRYGCQGGVCASCRAHLRSGEVEMHAHYGLEDYEIERGFILTCQSYPKTNELVVDFDRIH